LFGLVTDTPMSPAFPASPVQGCRFAAALNSNHFQNRG
jgi:hypothetical protein